MEKVREEKEKRSQVSVASRLTGGGRKIIFGNLIRVVFCWKIAVWEIRTLCFFLLPFFVLEKCDVDLFSSSFVLIEAPRKLA